jgi:hypothetical protein
LSHLFAAWPAGTYDFEGRSGAVEFEGTARLTHKIPAGPEITAPNDGDLVQTALDADVSRSETTFLVPKQYLEPNRIYEFEVLATERGGNQTITEGGVFCTPPIAAANCKKP